MIYRDVLSEKPEDTLAAIQWGKDEKARIEKSEAATKRVKERLTPIIIANFQKAKAKA